MRVVAVVHALWLCGTEKCPFDFATDGDSANSENKARVDLILSFSTAGAVDIRSELISELSALRPIGPSTRWSYSQSKMRSTLSVR